MKSIIRKLITKILLLFPPKMVLRILFRIDRWLYYFQGKLASAYNGGIHTKHRHMNYHQFFIDRIQPSDWVLDVGSNNGAVAYDIAKNTEAHVVGIEIKPEHVERACSLHAHPNVEYRVGNALTDLKNEHFDVIILSNVLEHLSGRPQFLHKLQTLTQPDRLLIRVPLFERDWRVPLKKELGVEWRLDPTHEIEYTLESFAQEMAEANLAVTYQEVRWGEIWAVTEPQ